MFVNVTNIWVDISSQNGYTKLRIVLTSLKYDCVAYFIKVLYSHIKLFTKSLLVFLLKSKE